MRVTNDDIEVLFNQQLLKWDLARCNYAVLQNVQTKTVLVEGVYYKIQFNPARIVSTGAKVDQSSIRARKCFLCENNRPNIQEGILFKSHYHILINPFPIFPRHITIAETCHLPQQIEGRFEDMLELAQNLTDYTIFYNGPKCGASAPDHAHFQAGNRKFMPIETDWKNMIKSKIVQYKDGVVYHLNEIHRSALIITATTIESARHLFCAVYHSLPKEMNDEPMMNLLVWYEEYQWTICVFPRIKHRPNCYDAEGAENLMCSPASVDLGGVFITPRETDFENITSEKMEQILTDVCVSPDKMTNICQRVINYI